MTPVRRCWTLDSSQEGGCLSGALPHLPEGCPDHQTSLLCGRRGCGRCALDPPCCECVTPHKLIHCSARDVLLQLGGSEACMRDRGGGFSDCFRPVDRAGRSSRAGKKK